MRNRNGRGGCDRAGKLLWAAPVFAWAGVAKAAKGSEDLALEEKTQSWNLVLVITLLGVCIFCTYLLLTLGQQGSRARWVRYLPESVVTIMLGVLAGSVLTVSGQTLSNLVTFDPQTFFCACVCVCVCSFSF